MAPVAGLGDVGDRRADDLTPIVVTTSTAALWTLIVFGVLFAATALWSLASPGSVASEYVHVALGVLLFISPWVFAYSGLGGAAWTSWVAGSRPCRGHVRMRG